jgi:hypothetical protein
LTKTVNLASDAPRKTTTTPTTTTISDGTPVGPARAAQRPDPSPTDILGQKIQKKSWDGAEVFEKQLFALVRQLRDDESRQILMNKTRD